MYVQYYNPSNGAKRLPFTDYTGFSNGLGSITVTGWWNTIVSPTYAMMGESVDKMGRTTGWTRGTIGGTCAPVAVTDASSGVTYVVTCADNVNNAAVGQGDSGSPVFVPPPSGQLSPLVPLGVLFAGGPLNAYFQVDGTYYCNSGCTYYYSPWDKIQTHMQSPFASH